MNRTALMLTAVAGAALVVALTLPDRQALDAEVPAPSFQMKTICHAGPAMTCDALDTTKKGAAYRRVRVPSKDCASYRLWSDGGTEPLGVTHTPATRRGTLEFVAGSCTGSPGAVPEEDAGVQLVAQECACRKAKGVCRIVSDAGVMDAPMGRTLGPGYPGLEVWDGAGCEPKACVELMGRPSWPDACPRR